MEIKEFNYFDEAVAKDEIKEIAIRNFFREEFPWIESMIESRLDGYLDVYDQRRYSVIHMIYSHLFFKYIEKYFLYELKKETTTEEALNLFDFIEKNIIKDIKHCKEIIFGELNEEPSEEK